MRIHQSRMWPAGAVTRALGLLALAAILAAGSPALAARPNGLDVSHWEPDITLEDWQTAYAAGWVFGWTKATESPYDWYNMACGGSWYTDNTLADYMVNARAAGLYMGCYHFAHPQCNTAIAEADGFVSRAGAYITNGYLRPALDLEDGSGLSVTALSNWVNAFMDRVEALTGVEPVLYINSSYATSELNATVASRDLWIAQYWTTPNPQGGTPSIGVFSTWWFWQWTSAGTVPGIGAIDSNVFNGTMAQLYGFVIGGTTSPSILIQPIAQTVPVGGTATFTVSAGGTPTLNYQWQKNSVDITSGGHCSGFTTNTLQVSPVDNNDVANYRCVVTNPYGDATSNAVALTIGTAITTYIVESRSGGQNYASYSDSGSWSDGSGKSTATGCTTGVGHRYCFIASGSPAATFKFTPTTTGSYQVFTTNCTTDNSGNPLVHTVAHAGGTTNVNVCQNSSCTTNAVNKWLSLGTFTLNAGTQYSVILDATSGSGSLPTGYAGRSDAIKWNFVSAIGPTITQHPTAQSICPGTSATFTVAATGTGTLTYQWQKNSADVTNGGHYANCTTASMTVSSADSNDAASYRCVVTDTLGSAYSNAAALTFKATTAISQQPAAQSVCPGTTATFSVTAAGDSLTYQWQKNGSNVTNGGHYGGCTTASLAISTADSNDVTSYRCVVTGTCGSAVTSSAAALTLKAATTITQHPSSQTVALGQAAEFTAAGTGEGTLGYQWQKNSSNITNGGQVSGATLATLRIATTVAGDAGSYRCVITGGCGTAVPTNVATLVVSASTRPGDFDNDTDVDLEDFAVLQGCLGVSSPAGNPTCAPTDLNADGVIDKLDVARFTGCMSGSHVPGNSNCLE